MSPTVVQFCLSAAKGGLELSALKLAQDFQSAGVNSICICRTNSFLEEAVIQKSIESFSINPKTTYFNPSTSLKLRKYLARLQPKAIFVHSLRDLWILYPATRGLKNTKIIGLAHMFVKNVNKKDFFHRLVYSQLNHLITMTKAQKTELQKCLPLPAEKYVLIPNGVDTEKFNPLITSSLAREKWQASSEEIVVGYVGRLDPMKGVFELFEAAQLLKDIPNLKFVVVGDDTLPEEPTKKKLEILKQEYELNERLLLLPFSSDIPNLMAGFDIFVMPSYEESFGLVLIEAMASGKACISTSAGGPPEILGYGEFGRLITPRSAKALAETIRDLINSPADRKLLGDKARKKAVETYDSLKIFEKIKSLAQL